LEKSAARKPNRPLARFRQQPTPVRIQRVVD
jgi:hypothetical protein